MFMKQYSLKKNAFNLRLNKNLESFPSPYKNNPVLGFYKNIKMQAELK